MQDTYDAVKFVYHVAALSGACEHVFLKSLATVLQSASVAP